MSSFRNSIIKDSFSVTFDTNYKTSGTIAYPTFTLNETISRVGKIKIDRVELACSYFVFNIGNNVLGSNINGGTITVTAGTYTPNTLAATLQNAIRATGGGFSSATVTYSATTFKFTITSGSASTFTLSASSTLAPVLGFSSTQSSTTSVTSDYPIYDSHIKLVADNRTFVINQSSTDYTFNIYAGNYDGVTLASTLQALISGTLSGFTVIYNKYNYTLTFTHSSTAFTFKGLSSSAGTALGITTDIASTSLSVSSEASVQIIGPTSILIKSHTLSQPRQLVVRSDDLYKECIYELSLNGSVGDIIYDKPEDSNELIMATVGGASFSTIDFRLIDDTGQLLNLGTNGRWKIYLIFETF